MSDREKMCQSDRLYTCIYQILVSSPLGWFDRLSSGYGLYITCGMAHATNIRMRITVYTL